MLTRFMLFLALSIQVCFAVAANDLEKWNSEEGRVVRSALKEKISTTTYTEKPNPTHVDSSYSSSANGGKVLQRLETSAQVKGSRVGATIEALKTVDKAAAAKKWAKEFAKGGVRFTAGAILIEAAMQEMLDGIGWVIDEGGKVTKRSESQDDGTLSDTYQYRCYVDGFIADTVTQCGKLSAASNAVNGISPSVVSCGVTNTVYCIFKYPDNSSYSSPVADRILRQNPIPETESNQVEESEMIEKIRDYFENPSSPVSKDLLIEQSEKPKGKASIMWSDDPSSEQTIYTDNKEKTERILNSDNPQGEGLTKTTPVITDGTTTEGETTPKPNPEPETITDPTTGQQIPNPNYNPNYDAGSTSSFELPAFCDYAAIVCDWIDWTKEEPEDEETEEEQNISDQGIFSRTFDFDFSLSGSCPPDYQITFTNKYFSGTWPFEMKWLCMFFSAIGYPLVFVAHCIGVWIFYEIAVYRAPVSK